MICRVCNSVNDPGTKYCIVCGSPFPKESTKVCPNGHVYNASLSKCPYCPSEDLKSKMGQHSDSTETYMQGGKGAPSDKTKIVNTPGQKGSSKTIIVGADTDKEQRGSFPVRKIVGWLITFSNRPEGEDFRILEGRNLISSSTDGDIIVNDPAVSSPHCMVLYRNGKIKIRDEMSTNGTYLNGEEIQEKELNDGDIIKIGMTELKFRSV